MTYKFYDTDSSGWEQYDIAGKEYQTLLDICFRYCTTVMFLVCIHTDDIPVFPDYLDASRLPVPQNTVNLYGHYGLDTNQVDQDSGYEIRCYLLSDAVKEYLRGHVKSLFQWIQGWGYSNPNDPAFLREDNSIFFCSTIHEGECSIFPHHNEDIADILKSGKWTAVDEE